MCGFFVLSFLLSRYIGSAIKPRNSTGQTEASQGQLNDATGSSEMADRDTAGLAVACWSAMNRVDLIRVHDVRVRHPLQLTPLS